MSAVRRALLLALLVAAAVPVVALAAAAPADGTLSVKAGDGQVSLNLKGAVIGLVGQGRVEIEAPKEDDCDELNVWDADVEKTRLKPTRVKAPNTGAFVTVCVFSGKDVRFRLIGQYQVRLTGKKISLSAVGRGPVTVKGDGGANDGTYAVNGSDHVSLPDDVKRFVLGPLPIAPLPNNLP